MNNISVVLTGAAFYHKVVYISIYVLHVCLSVHLYPYISLHLCPCFPIHLSFCLALSWHLIFPSIYLSIYPFIYLFISSQYYHYLYTYKLPHGVREWVNYNFNCEDIVFNFMVAHYTGLPPIKVSHLDHMTIKYLFSI